MMYLILSAISGFIVKLGDEYSEAKHITKKWYLSTSLGVLAAFFLYAVVYYKPMLAPLVIGGLLGNLLAYKIDDLIHYMTFILVALPLFMGYNIDVGLIILFTLAAWVDEYAHEHHHYPLDKRPFLPLATLLMFPRMEFFFSAVAFDIGYRVCETLIKHK